MTVFHSTSSNSNSRTLASMMTLAGAMAAAGGAEGKSTENSHGVFQMGGHLEYQPVMAMMTLIIVFTIFCEQVVKRIKRWVDYFNPLLHPCVDKVISELMILGATAFAIMLGNESTDNSLSNGSFMPVSWYHTLHWIDTVIFIFAVLYVAIASYMLTICEIFSNWLAKIDVLPLAEKPSNMDELQPWKMQRLRKHLQYKLIKQHFVKTFFGSHSMKFDFAFYIELTIIFGITSSFNIGVGEWVVLFVACVLTSKGIGPLTEYQVFTLACVVLLVVCVFVSLGIKHFFYRILKGTFQIENPHDIKELVKAVEEHVIPHCSSDADLDTTKVVHNAKVDKKAKKKKTDSTHAGPRFTMHKKRRTSDHRHHHYHHAFFHAFVHKPHNPVSHKLQHASNMNSLFVRPEEKKVYLCNIPLRESYLRKFVQRMMLTTCFYVAILLCSHLRNFKTGQMSGFWFYTALFSLLFTLFVIMPLMMLLGFSLAAVINANVSALQEIGKLKLEGESALMDFQVAFLQEYDRRQRKINLHDTSHKHNPEDTKAVIKEIFVHWANSKGNKSTLAPFSFGGELLLMPAVVRDVISKWAVQSGHVEFSLYRPKLLAMIRLIDQDRSVSIGLDEFSDFALNCLDQREDELLMEEESYANPAPSPRGQHTTLAQRQSSGRRRSRKEAAGTSTEEEVQKEVKVKQKSTSNPLGRFKTKRKVRV